jgi:hypothetical protein
MVASLREISFGEFCGNLIQFGASLIEIAAVVPPSQ